MVSIQPLRRLENPRIITVNLPAELVEFLNEFAAEERCTRSEILRVLVAREQRRHQRKGNGGGPSG